MTDFETRKLALFISSGTEDKTREEIIREARALEEWAENANGYTRISEYHHADFALRPADHYVPEQIEDLKEKKEELRKELEIKLAKIDELISTLAALEHKPESDEIG